MTRKTVARFPWLEGALLPVSYLLLLTGVYLIARAALTGASAADTLPGVAAFVAALFGLGLSDLLGQMLELHARLARLEFNPSGNLPKAEERETPAK